MTPIDWLMSRDTGISSKTICSVMTGSNVPVWHATPSDPDDFGRCYRLLVAFPEWRARMPEVAAKYPQWGPLVAAWDELTALYARCSDKDGKYTREAYEANKDAASLLYDRMHALNDAGYETAGWTRDGPNCWRAPTGRTDVHCGR